MGDALLGQLWPVGGRLKKSSLVKRIDDRIWPPNVQIWGNVRNIVWRLYVRYLEKSHKYKMVMANF